MNDAVRGAGGGIAIDLRGTPAGTDVALTGPGTVCAGFHRFLLQPARSIKIFPKKFSLSLTTTGARIIRLSVGAGFWTSGAGRTSWAS